MTFDECKNRFFIYCDGLYQINARKEAIPYYQHLIKEFPEWKENLEKAIIALDQCADYGGYLWSQGFTFDDAGFEKFRSPEARKNLADAGRESMKKDEFAIEQFEDIIRQYS